MHTIATKGNIKVQSDGASCLVVHTPTGACSSLLFALNEGVLYSPDEAGDLVLGSATKQWLQGIMDKVEAEGGAPFFEPEYSKEEELEKEYW